MKGLRICKVSIVVLFTGYKLIEPCHEVELHDALFDKYHLLFYLFHDQYHRCNGLVTTI